MDLFYKTSGDIDRRRVKMVKEMMRTLRGYISQQDYTNSQFYCEYLLHMIRERDSIFLRVIYLCVEVYFNLKEFWRCVNIIKKRVFPPKEFIEHKELFAHPEKPYLFLVFVNSLLMLGKYQRANNYLCGNRHKMFIKAIKPAKSIPPFKGIIREVKLYLEFLKLKAKLCLLCGDPMASEYYKEVFYQDPFQMSIFFHILHNDLLTPLEMGEMIWKSRSKLSEAIYYVYFSHLPINTQSRFRNQLTVKYPFMRSAPPLLLTTAFDNYQHHNYEGCLHITTRMMETNGFNLLGTSPSPHSAIPPAGIRDGQYRSSITSSSNVIVLHINSQMQLDKKSDLFYTSHKLLENHPDNPVTYYSIAAYYTLLKKTEIIINYLRRCLKAHDRFLDAWILLGHTYSNMDKLTEAVRCYRTAYLFFPKNPFPPYYLAQSHIRMGNLSLAKEFITKAITLRKKFRSSKKQDENEKKTKQSQQQQQQQQQPTHSKKPEKLVDEDEDEDEEIEGEDNENENENENEGNEKRKGKTEVDPDTETELPEFLLELGVIKFGMKDYEGAKDCFIRALKMKKKHKFMNSRFWYILYYNLGNCFRKLGRFVNAVNFYKKALRIELNDPQVYVQLGLTYHIIGNYDKAIETYHNALQIIESSDTHFMPHYFSTFLLKKALVKKSKVSSHYVV